MVLLDNLYFICLKGYNKIKHIFSVLKHLFLHDLSFVKIMLISNVYIIEKAHM